MRPIVAFEHGGRRHELRPRLVIGADGRNGPTRQQAGIPVHADPMGYWIGGMLVEGADDWPPDDFVLGTEGWRHLIVFPQGGGRLRLYICVRDEHRPLILGSDGPRNILKAFVAESLPHAEAIAGVRPISDPYAYPNNDTWTDTGQGDWSAAAFRPYAEERAVRMARLRRAAQFTALREMDLSHEGRARRERIRQRLRHRPELRNVMMVPLLGPYALPPQTYAEESYRALSR
jgi:2-polyprenyl-6-methoxyphenol hydroxylase-like FAD-dependent oxidoreductase